MATAARPPLRYLRWGQMRWSPNTESIGSFW
jgi:hypothetical protein